MKFILDRTSDYKTKSKKWIVGYGLLFWLMTRILAAAIVMACAAVYEANGLDPQSMTRFGGTPQAAETVKGMIYAVFTVIIVAPLFEECIFRLGLSFRKRDIAAGMAFIPLYILFQKFAILSIGGILIYLAGAVAVFCLIFFLCRESALKHARGLYFRSVVWLSAIAFGLIHLIAFSHYSWELLPYMLCMILVPFFAGCAITYYRINLGFWWGLGLHIFNNLPGAILILTM